MARSSYVLNAAAYLHPSCTERDRVRFQSDVVAALGAHLPAWTAVSPANAVLTHVSGAMTNVIFTCEKRVAPQDKVLVRIYGHGTEAFFSRQEEIRVFQELSRQNLGVSLLGEFQNGRVESMIDGRTATASDIRIPEFSAKIAKKMALFHTTQVDMDRNPRILNNIHKLFKDAKTAYASGNRTSFDVDAMARDIQALEALLATVDSPVVFCHNDLQYGNIMATDTNDAVMIDFEYSHYNPRGYDLGNHFSEWCYDYHGAAPHMGDFCKYPTVAEQRHFCAAYLGDSATESTVEDLRHEANVYANATHLFWSLWGFIQATQSAIDFDYFGYAMCRWNAFKMQVSMQNRY
ncbi:unnamed protein product [Aphanomyces euteiches]|uniref:Choline kinase N-terminal domain-containing protein n=1 Tax=Aphanomyces euteiches TaxID=100861 RepID=A0A6G0XNY9_9STRA|nr:hypothetical protein Ae201684_002877 [Aphanomyces euteiches]KAH9093184.1 hypothetical protein Ae201684P_008843 [Aphanomyces euteiches]KAH9151154.1 hypothetical protein AeRB84_006169 [Aphanomyces euteiches]